MNEIHFSIVIPLYNEQDNIFELYNQIAESDCYKFCKEIILINDCSNDNTKNNINLVMKKDSKIKYSENDTNRGQSFSIFAGAKKSLCDIIVTLDGDLQNNPNDIINLYNEYITNNYKLIGGIRKNRKDNLIKVLSSKIANTIRRFILSDNCDDTGCSLKIFDKHIFLSIPFFKGMHRFIPAFYSGFGYKTKFIYVDHRKRINGKSKYGTIKRLFDGIIDIYKVKKYIKKYKQDNNIK